jgi:hypothetical protein
MLSEVERAKLIVSIDKLKKDKAAAEREYERVLSNHSYAAGAYGSELCAASMIAEERNLAQKVRDINKRINLLEEVLKGVVLKGEEELRKKLDEIDLKLAKSNADLSAEKSEIKAQLDEAKFIRSILERP